MRFISGSVTEDFGQPGLNCAVFIYYWWVLKMTQTSQVEAGDFILFVWMGESSFLPVTEPSFFLSIYGKHLCGPIALQRVRALAFLCLGLECGMMVPLMYQVCLLRCFPMGVRSWASICRLLWSVIFCGVGEAKKCLMFAIEFELELGVKGETGSD